MASFIPEVQSHTRQDQDTPRTPISTFPPAPSPDRIRTIQISNGDLPSKQTTPSPVTKAEPRLPRRGANPVSRGPAQNPGSRPPAAAASPHRLSVCVVTAGTPSQGRQCRVASVAAPRPVGSGAGPGEAGHDRDLPACFAVTVYCSDLRVRWQHKVGYFVQHLGWIPRRLAAVLLRLCMWWAGPYLRPAGLERGSRAGWGVLGLSMRPFLRVWRRLPRPGAS